MFQDEASFRVRSGDGGAGRVSFRREKYVPYGGPDGGDGGDGGDVVLRGMKGLRTLSVLRGRRYFKGENGGDGGVRRRHGKSGADCIIELPVGTVIKEGEEVVLDIKESGDYVIARGGKGGRGNVHFARATLQVPMYAQSGRIGCERELAAELKLIADVGLVGIPNAGKSSLLSCLSNAYPKIGSYPFTTLEPNLGVVNLSELENYVMADIPGLIEGASKGVGLGIKFLKHIERTKVLLFLLDTSCFEGQFELLMKELLEYEEGLLKKRYAICLNKLDLYMEEELEGRMEIFKLEYKASKYYREDVLIYGISCATGYGLSKLKKGLYKLMHDDYK